MERLVDKDASERRPHQLSFNAAYLKTLEEAQELFAEALCDIYYYYEFLVSPYKTLKPYKCSLSDQELLYAFWRGALIINKGWEGNTFSIQSFFNVSLRLDLSQCSQKRYHQPFKADVKKEDWEKAMSKIAQDEINKEVIKGNLDLIKNLSNQDNKSKEQIYEEDKLKEAIYKENNRMALEILGENIEVIEEIIQGQSIDKRPERYKLLDFPRKGEVLKNGKWVEVMMYSFFDKLLSENPKLPKDILIPSGREEIMDDFHPWLFYQYIHNDEFNLSKTKVTYRGRQYQARDQYDPTEKKKEVIQYENENYSNQLYWDYPEMKIKNKIHTFKVPYKLEDLLIGHYLDKNSEKNVLYKTEAGLYLYKN